MCNVPVVDLVCLTCLLQSMAKVLLEEVTKELKLVKLLHLGFGGHNDRLTKLFGGDKRCYDGQ